MRKSTYDLDNIEKTTENIKSYGYDILRKEAFVKTKNLPDGLLARARKTIIELTEKSENSDYVVYDPDDDKDGWMLIGDRQEILTETAKNIIDMRPKTGPYK